jgi:hypothetical protein
METFKKLFPSRNTFTFPHGLIITSDLDQGNLAKCVKVASKHNKETDYNFEAHLSPDSWPYMPELNAGRAGFFFSVTGVPE